MFGKRVCAFRLYSQIIANNASTKTFNGNMTQLSLSKKMDAVMTLQEMRTLYYS